MQLHLFGKLDLLQFSENGTKTVRLVKYKLNHFKPHLTSSTVGGSLIVVSTVFTL
jgi:hypothetical protein